MSRKIPPEEYTKYGKFIEDEGQYDCRTIYRVLEIIDEVNDDLDFGTKEKGVALSIKEKVLTLKGEPG